MEKRSRISGYVMAFVGFIMILINALGYIFNLDIGSPALVIIGIVFVGVGMRIVKKGKN